MRILTTALLLALCLTGCADRGSHSSNQPHSSSSMRSDPANYHASNFGEPNNEPFQGVYPGR